MRIIGLFASVMLLSACGSESTAVGLSTRVGAARSATSGLAKAEQRLAVSNGITLERVRLSVKKLELELEGDDADDGQEASEGSDPEGTENEQGDGESKLHAGPFLIDLSKEALSGTVIRLQDVQVAAGTYDEIEFEIEKVSLSEAGDDAGLKEMAQLEASVIIDGTIDGQPFRFVSGLSQEQEREVRFEVTPESAENVTINIDPSAWFTGSSGQRLDPRDSEFRSSIEENIKRSIDAFDDEDEDGGEDEEDEDGQDASND